MISRSFHSLTLPLTLLTTTILLSACGTSEERPSVFDKKEEATHIEVSDFQQIIDDSGLKGSILIFDGKTFFSNDFDWADVGRLPASTYKIPNSLIALELGIMEDDSTMSIWDGQPRFLKRWERDMNFRDAFHLSCVPCYQEIARKIGTKRMNQFAYDFNYGEMDIDSSNIDMFWLEGKSRISQYQQIDFLQALNEQRLPISERTYKIIRRMMIIEENEKFTLRGKTGWSVAKDKDNCWFVGWVETKQGAYYFATNVEPGPNTNGDDLFTLRKEITYKALEFVAL